MPVFLVRVLILGFCLVWSQQVYAESRTALVIGNSKYGFGPLVNPANDARLMAETLKKKGFDVTVVLDADRQTMQKALLAYSRDIRDKDTVGLFYFAGHGAQTGGANYLIPVDADIKAEQELKIFGINVDEFVATLERSDGRINIVILDSCRNNPFGAGARSARRGLAAIDAPSGTFIAYSTAPGQVALDGTGSNSPYAEALAKAMEAPGASIEQVFKVTRRDVLSSTDNAQTPWESSSLTGDFYFSEAEKPKEVVAAPAPKVEDVPKAPEETQVAAAAPEVKAVEPVEEQIAPVVVENTPEPTVVAAAKEVEEISPQERIMPVGKWPEGIILANNAIYVAESGSRRIVKLDPNSGALLETYTTGRLPVHLTSDPDGNVYVNVITEGKIFKQPVQGKGKAIAAFKRPTYVQGIGFGNGAVYTASYNEAGNRQNVISRIDPKSGKMVNSDPFGAEPRAFVVAGNMPWVLDSAGDLTVLDAKTLLPIEDVGAIGFAWSIGANLDAVYVGGRQKQQLGRALIRRHAMGNADDSHSEILDGEELIVAIAANDNRVAALGDQGTVWILDASSLNKLKRFSTGRRPQAALFMNGDLFISTHAGEGENGSILVYSDVGNLD